MTTNLRNRSLISIDDVSSDEIRFLLRLAGELKSAKYAGTEKQRLAGKNLRLPLRCLAEQTLQHQ